MSALAAGQLLAARVSGAGIDDFSFSKIYINDQYAILKVGTFESATFLYEVSRLTDGYLLSPIAPKNLGWAKGKEVRLQVINVSPSGSFPLTSELLKPGAVLRIMGSPRGAGEFEATGFKIDPNLDCQKLLLRD